MADFKTYTCDMKGCGKQGAIRFTFPRVDTDIDPADGRRVDVEGDADLCHEHAHLIVEAFTRQGIDIDKQRKAWRWLHGEC